MLKTSDRVHMPLLAAADQRVCRLLNLCRQRREDDRMDTVNRMDPDFWEKEGRRMTDFGTFLVPCHRLHYMGGRRAGMFDKIP